MHKENIDKLIEENHQLKERKKIIDKEYIYILTKYYDLKYILVEIRDFILSFDYYIPEDCKDDLLKIIEKGVNYE